jgi:hypothetical protein
MALHLMRAVIERMFTSFPATAVPGMFHTDQFWLLYLRAAFDLDESFSGLANGDGTFTVAGFGSLLSERSARTTFPDLRSFRPGKVNVDGCHGVMKRDPLQEHRPASVSYAAIRRNAEHSCTCGQACHRFTAWCMVAGLGLAQGVCSHSRVGVPAASQSESCSQMSRCT